MSIIKKITLSALLVSCLTVMLSVSGFSQTWTLKGFGAVGAGFNSVASIGPTLIVGNSMTGIFISTDNGTSWQKSNQGLSEPYQISALYTFGSLVFLGTNSGAYYSSDQGNSWVALPLTGYVSSFQSIGSTLYATVNFNVYRSLNNGLSWSKTDGAGHTLGVVGTAIFVGDSNGNIFVSSDGATTWNQTLSGASYIYSITGSNTIVLAATNIGLYRSSDSGITWNEVAGFSQWNVNFYFVSTVGSRFIGVGNYGSQYSDDGGITWISSNIQNLNSTASQIASIGSDLFLATWGSGLYRSTDQGLNWQLTAEELLNPGPSVITTRGNTIITGDFIGISRSADNGLHWNRININGITFGQVMGLINNNNVFFAALYGYGLFVSNDDGVSWSLISAFPEVKVSSLYLSDDGKIFVGTDNGLYISTDQGATWNKTGFNVATEILNIAVEGNTIQVAAFNGVWVSTDGGSSWQKIFNYAICMAAYKNYVFVSNYDGLYLSSDFGFTWSQLSIAYLNFPYNEYVNRMTTDGESIYFSTTGGHIFVGGASSFEQVNFQVVFNPNVTCLNVSENNLYAGVELSGRVGGNIWSTPTTSFVTINDVSPSSGKVGSLVTLTGSNFDPVPKNNQVEFNGVVGTVISASSNSIQVLVPYSSGKFKINLISPGHNVFTNNQFTIIPEIQSLSPSGGITGTYFTINGSGFDCANINYVHFTGISGYGDTQPSKCTSTRLGVVVPYGSLSGPLSIVDRQYITVATSEPFSVFPELTILSPRQGISGTVVEIYGRGIDPNEKANYVLRFNGTVAPINTISYGQIETSVPIGAKSGAVTLESNGKVFTSSDIFLVYPLSVNCYTYPSKPVITIVSQSTQEQILESSNKGGNQWYLNGTAIDGANDSILVVNASGNYTVKTTIEGCSSTMSDGLLISITGDIVAQTAVDVFPNPASTEIIVNLDDIIDELVHITLLDINGKTCLETSATGGRKTSVDVKSLSSGLYIVRVASESGVWQTKFSKM